MRHEQRIFTLRYFLSFLLASPLAVSGGTLYVDNTATPNQNGTSWALAFTELQDALASAAAGDQIWVAAGVYFPDRGVAQTDNSRTATFQLLSGVEIYGGFAGNESQLLQRDVAKNKCILSGDIDTNDNDVDGNKISESPLDIVGANSLHVVTASGTDQTARIDGFTISAGLADGPVGESTSYGAGVYCVQGSTKIESCVIVGNQARSGGGIFLRESAPELRDNVFTGNAADLGGALSGEQSAPLILDCQFENNQAVERGGAFSVTGSMPNSLTQIMGCSFFGNSSQLEGGAIALISGVDLQIERCSFRGNSAAQDGGVIYNLDSSYNIESSVLSGNFAGDDGGALYNRKASLGNPEVSATNCTISGNSSTGSGGGIYNSSSSPPLIIANTIIWNNQTSDAHPPASQSIHSSNSGFVPIIRHSLLEHVDLTGSGEGNLNGSDPANAPSFAASLNPASAPSQLGNLRLLPGSPAIDAGDDSAATSLTDLAENPRIRSPHVDLGAYEIPPGPAVVTPVSPLSFPFGIPSQEGIVDLAIVFDETATSFGIESITPPGGFTASLDGSMLGLSGIDSNAVGIYVITVWASDGDDQASYDLNISVFAERIFVDHGAAPGGDGLSWSSAFTTLQDGLNLVGATAIESIIWITGGTYYPDDGIAHENGDPSETFLINAGTRIYGGFAGIETALDQRIPQNIPTVLSGDISQDDLNLDGNMIAETTTDLIGVNSSHVVTISGNEESGVAELYDITITAGMAGPIPTGWGSSGGGVYCDDLTGAKLSNCTLCGNSATNDGGAIVATTPLHLVNCQLYGNLAGDAGGAIYASQSSGDWINTTFRGNRADGRTGGGAVRFGGCSNRLLNCTFSGNSSASAGGAFFSNHSSIEVHNSIIWNNEPASSEFGFWPTNSPPRLYNSIARDLPGGIRDNLNGNDPLNAPKFLVAPDPQLAPSSFGDLRLPSNSPLVDQGDNLANPLVTDLAGNPRISGGTIDLGAFETDHSPALIGEAPPRIRLMASTETHPDFLDLQTIFDGSATGFSVAYVTPAPGFNLSLSGSSLSMGGVGSHSQGTYHITVSATDDAGGQTFYQFPVRIDLDRIYVDSSAPLEGDGASWATALPSLQDAIALAKDYSIGEIWAADGVYFPDDGADQIDGSNAATFQLYAGLGIYGGFAGDEISRGQRDPATNITVLSGDIGQNDLGTFPDQITKSPTGIRSVNSRHVVNGSGTDSSAILDGFTVSAGDGTQSDFSSDGGGLFIMAGSPTVNRCSFIGNDARYGGGVFIDANSSPSFNDCSFESNGATSGGAVADLAQTSLFEDCNFTANHATDDGGAIRLQASGVTIANCTFQNNTAENTGGAMFNTESATPTLTGVTFEGNSALSGGAISNVNASPFANSCLFAGNSATQNGGAILNQQGSGPTYSDCDLSSNSSRWAGGAAYDFNSSPIYSRCLVRGNWTDGSGGGLASSLSTPLLVDCVLSGNKAKSLGGAVKVENQSVVRIVNCTLTANLAESLGGAIFSSSFTSTQIGNTIIWSNQAEQITATRESSVDGLGTFTFSHCLLEHADLRQTGSGNLDGAAPSNPPLFAIPSSPSLAPSTTGYFRPLSSSPTIDKGNSADTSSTIDLAGSPRSGGGEIDLGAYESSGPSIVADIELINLPPNPSDQLEILDLSAIFDQSATSFSIANITPPGILSAQISGSNLSLTEISQSADGWVIVTVSAANAAGESSIYNVPIHIGLEKLFIDQNAAPGGDGLSWATALNSLQDAFLLARQTSTGELWVAAGVYHPDDGIDVVQGDPHASFELNFQTTVLGGFSGTESERSQRSPATNLTILSGDIDDNDIDADSNKIAETSADQVGENSNQILRVTEVDRSTVLDGLIITGASGGGAYIYLADPTLVDCSFSGNSAIRGGAIAIYGSSPVLIDCRLTGNTATDDGGAMYNSPTADSSQPQLFGCVICSNSARFGGGIFTFRGSNWKNQASLSLTNCVLSGNLASFGGSAIYFRGTLPIRLTNCTVTGNHAVAGLAIYSENPGFLTNTIAWNNAAGYLTTSPSASLHAPALSQLKFDHCLVQGFDLTGQGSGNLNGLDPSNAPTFVLAADPFAAPSPLGDLRPQANSGAIDAGRNLTSIATDIDQNPRPNGNGMDLGAHEFFGPATIAPQPSFSFPFDVPTQLEFVDLATLFEASATDFRIEELRARGSVSASVDGSFLNLANIGPSSLGNVSVLVSASANGYRSFLEIRVNIIADRLYVSSGVAAGGTGHSWNSSLLSLQDALAIAAEGATAEIWVAAGSYFPDEGSGIAADDPRASFQLAAGVSVIGGFAGDEVDLSDRDLELNPSVLSGDISQDDANLDGNGIAKSISDILGINSFHVVVGPESGNTATLDGFIITAGATAASFAEGGTDGGGILIRFSSPIIRNCEVIGNRARSGGGIQCTDGASPAIYDCTFRSNFATESGGGMQNFDGASPLLKNCLFENNRSDSEGDSSGGAISNVEASSPRLIGCRLSGNSSDYGGAVSNQEGSRPIFIHCTLSGNLATSYGGAVENRSSFPVFKGCTLSGNSSTGFGGAVYNGNGATQKFQNTIVWNNHATSGTPGSVLDANRFAQSYFEFCLVEEIDLRTSGSGNFDGTNTAYAPMFTSPVNPAEAPTAVGDFNLLAGSPMIDLGDNAATLTGTDFDLNPRIQDGDGDQVYRIDLGAHEFQSQAIGGTFANSYPELDPDADENNNGRSNFFDYAVGSDPGGEPLPGAEIIIRDSATRIQLTFFRKLGVKDSIYNIEISHSLQPETWRTLIEGIDYEPTSSGNQFQDRESVTLDVFMDPPNDSEVFFRLRISAIR